MLDGLFTLFEALKARIDSHRDILSRNEAATRYALIDPVLTALGWDLADPAQVRVEYNTSSRSGRAPADYALLVANQGTPRVIIEAKRLDRALLSASDQAIGYCVGQGIPYFVVTDGEKWAAYDTFKPVPTQEKLIVRFALSDDAQANAIKALWLWRGNFEVPAPVVPVVPERVSLPVPPTPPPGNSLSEFVATGGQPPPQALVFPGDIAKEISRWADIQAVVVEWLSETSQLTVANCPVVTRRGAHLVHTENRRADGAPFKQAKPIGRFWIDVSRSAPRHVWVAQTILRECHVDPATVRVIPHS